MQPLSNRLAAYTEEACRFGLAEAPYIERAREGPARTLPIEAFGEGVKPSALMPVRSENLLGCFVRGEVPDGRDPVHVSSPNVPQPCVSRNRMSTANCVWLVAWKMGDAVAGGDSGGEPEEKGLSRRCGHGGCGGLSVSDHSPARGYLKACEKIVEAWLQGAYPIHTLVAALHTHPVRREDMDLVATLNTRQRSLRGE